MEKKMFLRAGPKIFVNARHLRENLTHSELILWAYLRQKPGGYKFRRQHPISIYIADFYYHPLRLIIEIDGGVHSDIAVAQHDKERQINLESEGMSFLRFTNGAIEKDLESVIKTIENFIAAHEHSKSK